MRLTVKKYIKNLPIERKSLEKLGRGWWLGAVLMVVFSSFALLEVQSEEMPMLW
jgi:hypothetical protein